MQVYRAFQTVIEMCEDRGYEIKQPKMVVEKLLQRDQNMIKGGGKPISSSSSAACLTFPWFKNFIEAEAHENFAEQEEGGESALNFSQKPLRIQNFTLVCKKVHTEQGEGVLRTKEKKSNDVQGIDSAVVVKKEEGEVKLEEMDHSLKTKLLVFFVFGEKGKSGLSMNEVMRCRREAIHRNASRAIIVASSIPSAVRRETREVSGVASYVAMLPGEKKDLLSSTTDTKQVRGASTLPHGTNDTQGSSSAAAAPTLSPYLPPVALQIELFEQRELLFNPSHHETVPRHSILSESDIQALLQKYQVHRNQLPRILLSDPMVRYIGATRGMVVHIHRESEDSGPYSMYRQVV